MSSLQLVAEETITATDVKDMLERIQERDEELSFRAGKTVDHLNHLSLADAQTKQARIEAIQALEVPRLKLHHIHKIIDLSPRTLKELGVVLSGYTLTVTKEYQQKIMDALAA